MTQTQNVVNIHVRLFHLIVPLAMLPISAINIVLTLVLGSLMLLLTYIASVLSPDPPPPVRIRRKHWVPPNSPKLKPYTWSQMNVRDTERVQDLLLSTHKNVKSFSSPIDTEESTNFTKRWFLSPKKPRFPTTVNLRPKDRWDGFSKNAFFPSRPRVNLNGKIRKPPVMPPRSPGRLNNLAPGPKKPANNLPLPPKIDLTGKIPELPKQEWVRYAPLTMKQIDPIYDHLCRFLTVRLYDVNTVTAANLRWAADCTSQPKIDWDNYLEYRGHRFDAQKRLKQVKKDSKSDPYFLTKAQIGALLRTNYKKASIDDVYHEIAASTARANPTADFLKMIQQRYEIRRDIDWVHYFENYLYRVKSPTTKPLLEEIIAKTPVPAKLNMNELGRPIDILGNEIQYARNKVGDLTPSLDIELTMSGGLHTRDVHPEKNTKRRIANIRAPTPSLANRSGDADPHVQTWRLIKGTKLPKSLWQNRRKAFNNINQPFIDALQGLNPPVRLDQYYITKAALLRVVELKKEIISRTPGIAKLLKTRWAKMSEEELQVYDGINQSLDAHTIRLLIAFGGQLRPSGEIIVTEGMYGLDHASFPECLQRMVIIESRENWSEEDKSYWKDLDAQVEHYWAFLINQANRYWQSIMELLEASKIIVEPGEPESKPLQTPNVQVEDVPDGFDEIT